MAGLGAGVGTGLYLADYDEPRTLPASILTGMAVGALIDWLNGK